ncbi:TrkH family potassium uptake protein [Planosporangium flavigriseum]|uniref:Potassium transporter Trk n=1 Tax=Planosporangium flavigriseum TaxID=373681 RepID=A0A8J3PLH5_9ACTN|nr:potassium transporter TrkG [Planosporangium flavigriseum]NJC65395.1 TrkH family potassium uptake protein [Planosporangium flavigriseum]GIG73249.1 potassium transporter Trk [Planosporangium flavigriseum]
MRRTLRHPARIVPIAFLLAIGVGTGLLMLPAARAGVHPPGADQPSPLTALFTAASAVCVTGLTVVDTATYWSTFGHVVIMALMQVGGYGIMTLATLLGLLVSRRLGLRTRLIAQAETRITDLSQLRRLLVRVAVLMLAFEVVIAVVLALRLRIGYRQDPGTALWHGAFHAVSAFNNGGFSLYPDNLLRFATDPWICLPIAIAVATGSLGFPVLFELAREFRTPARWSVHTRITVYGSLVLLAAGALAVLLFEWTNPATLGRFDVPGKILNAVFQGVMPRSGGFNTVDYGRMNPETLAVTDALMFIGAGSAGTGGGIKVTTFFLLAFVLLAEVRGDPDVVVGRRRIPVAAQRQALTIALFGVLLVFAGTLAVQAFTPHPPDRVLFEVLSAFGTVGLSTGITASLPPPAQLLLVILMFLGRVGTITVATGLALRERKVLYRHPEERPIVG